MLHVYISVLNGALWDMEPVHSGIWSIAAKPLKLNLKRFYYRKHKSESAHYEDETQPYDKYIGTQETLISVIPLG